MFHDHNASRSLRRFARLAWAGTLVLALAAVLAPAAPASAAAYTILDLGTLGGEIPFVSGVNASGQVVGFSISTSSFNTGHAFRTAPNGPITAASDLGTLGGTFGTISSANGVNASGQAVGSSGGHAFRTAPNGSITPASDLGALGGGGSHAEGINASGQVVGYSPKGYDGAHAFRTAPNGSITPASDLGGGPWGRSFAWGVNASGQAVGDIDATGINGDPELHAFRTAPNGPIGDLGPGSASAINDSGQAVGYSTTTIWDETGTYILSSFDHAFRTAPNGPITLTSDLGTLGGTNSYAAGINASGQTVGVSALTGDVVNHAFFADVTGAMQDLNDLIPSGSGWVLNGADGINDSGQIAGSGTVGGEMHAFLLTPTVPEPASLSLLGLGCVGLLARRRRR